MGQECSNCKTCTDQEEIRAEQSISANHIVTKTINGINKDKINRTSQKSTNLTVTTSQTINNNIKAPILNLKKNNNQKYKRKEGRKSTLDSIQFNSKKKSEFEEELRQSINSIQERKNSFGGSSGGSSFLSESESCISISNKLFIDEINDSPSKKYEILAKLGSGSFGNVYLARNKVTDEKVALKQIKKSTANLLSDGEIKDEIEILKTLDHPDIVRIIESFNTKNSYILITEYCEGGELFDQVKNQLSETQIAVIFRQLLSGLAYLHSNNIVHRDLKLENILIHEIEKSKTTGEDLFNIKIIDFGTARIFDKNRKPQSIVGSSYYIAPEVLRQKYNKECDLWSVGVILYMFIVGHAPFDGCDDEEITNNIHNGVYRKNDKRWVKASNEVKDLIQKLLTYRPSQRLTAMQALNHPWFKITDSNILYDNVPKSDIINCIRNLLTYNINYKLEELFLAYIIHNIPREKKAKSAIKLFKLVNENGDGKLRKNELRKTLLRFVTEEFLEKYDFDGIFAMMDGENKGFVNYEEFLRAALGRKDILTDDILSYAFNYFDPEGTGFIKKKKIKSIFGNKIDNITFQSIFDEIDLDKDGKITFDDFKSMLLY